VRSPVSSSDTTWPASRAPPLPGGASRASSGPRILRRSWPSSRSASCGCRPVSPRHRARDAGAGGLGGCSHSGLRHRVGRGQPRA
jgi:hypothetical protein